MSTCAARPTGNVERRKAAAPPARAAARPPAWRILAPAAAAAALCLGSASGGAAAPRVGEHRVQRGDTLAALAERYYGDKERAELLARLNDIEEIRNLKVGSVLRVPFSARYRVSAGDTPSRLAEKMLKGASRHAALMEMNGRSPRSALAAGAEIEIPVLLEHRLGKGETLGSVARRYYGDAGRAAWLARFNAIDKPDAIAHGTRLEVPLVGLLPVRKSKTETDSRSASSTVSKAPAAAEHKSPSPPAASRLEPKAAAGRKEPPPARRAAGPDPAVGRALELYHRGEYRRAADLFEAALESGGLPAADKTRALRFRAYCAVALGDRAAARQAFQALRRHDPAWKPDPIEDSPKIRQSFSEAVSASSAPRSSSKS